MRYSNSCNNRHNIFSDFAFNDLENQLNALFGTFSPLGSATDASAYSGAAWYQNEDGYTVRIDLPGVDPKAVELSVKDGQVELRAERVFPASGDAEAKTSKIARSIAIPEGVDEAKIGAKHEDGVLSIAFPKAEAVKPRKIEVASLN